VYPKKANGPELDSVLSSFSALPRNAQVEVVSSLLREVAREKSVHPAELLDDVVVPFGIFSQDKLSCLEAIVKYLKEVKGMKLAAIASAVGRDSSTVWATYAKAARKMPEPFSRVRDDVVMPVSVIADRSLSVLEHVVTFAKKLGFSNHEIAVMLHLDDRTIWSVLNRARKKRGGQE
jgi:predicted DNA-binding protein (UPF0251 family)